MTFSVLMSVYQKETADNLEQCFESIWTRQTLRPDAVVLVRDGELNDGLNRVITQWKESLQDRLVLLDNERNSGLTVSLNKGLAVVQTDLVARMDTDDISLPDRFEKQVRYLEEHPEVAVLGGSIQEFDENSDCLVVRHYPKSNVAKFMAKASPVAHPVVMMRMELFREGGISYNEKYRVSQDIALWYDIVKAGYQITNLPDVLLKFRRSGEVIVNRSREKAKGEFEIYMKGIRSLHGILTWRYVYPIAR